MTNGVGFQSMIWGFNKWSDSDKNSIFSAQGNWTVRSFGRLKFRRQKFRRRKFRRRKFRRRKIRRRKFRRTSKSRNFVVRNFVVRNFVIGNYVVLIRVNSVNEKTSFELFNYQIIKLDLKNKFQFDTKIGSKS